MRTVCQIILCSQRLISFLYFLHRLVAGPLSRNKNRPYYKCSLRKHQFSTEGCKFWRLAPASETAGKFLTICVVFSVRKSELALYNCFLIYSKGYYREFKNYSLK